jgi:4-methyl-5(b-hydroxyethyl)-thiazole monophosphate biosynthesis
MTNVLVPLANGVEEMEAVIIIDVLRRAQWNVVTAGIDAGVVTASRGVRLVPDTAWLNLDPSGFDVLMIPGGGPGVERLLKDQRFLETIRSFNQAGKWIGAVCAAPLTLQAAGILQGKRVTCHPGVAAALTATSRLNDRVVIDGKLVTSQGPGTTFEFALTLIRLLEGPEKALSIAQSMGV